MPTEKPQTNETQYADGFFDRFIRRVLFARQVNAAGPKAGRAKTKDVLRLYYESLRRYPVVIFAIFAAVASSSVISIIIPLFYKHFFDLLVGGGGTSAGGALRQTIFIILGLNFAGFICWRTSNFSNQYLSSNMMGDLRTRAFSYLIDHSQRFFTGMFTGTLVQRVNRFANAYDRLADRVIYDIVPIIIQVIGVMVVLLNERPVTALIIICWTVLFVVCNYVFARWKLKYDIAAAAQDSKTTGVLADIITNQPTVDAHGSHEFEKERYGNEVRTQMRMMRFRWNLSESMETVQALLVVLVEFAIFYVGIGLWERHEFSIGMFVLVQAYIIRLSGQLWSFSRIIRDVYESFADAKEMAEIMLTPHEIKNAKEVRSLERVDGCITFDNVSFGYHTEGTVGHFSTVIKPGERVALVGPSGARKSTIIKLLFRFYDPSSGEICIDGVPIRQLPLTRLREILSLVPQDPLLFHRSIMENIRYGKPGASDDAVILAATLAHCDEFIERLPGRFDTLVGERGIKLSGGERQRVALARAFLRNAPIIVLDEATSSLDSESERYIQEALAELMKGRTTIVIAHRLSTIRSVDRIIVMDKGSIIEDGTHDALLEKKGMYSKLWGLQQGGFIVSEPTQPT